MTHLTRALLAGAALLAAPAAMAAEFDLDALLQAARGEPRLSVTDSTGKIKTMAENFGAKYGLEAVGTKMKPEEQVEMMLREAQAGNIQTDVAIISDGPAVVAQLIPARAVESWLPPDLADHIAPARRDPLVVVSMVNAFAYNTELSDSCPIHNLWELTEPKWRGHVAMEDPLGKSVYVDAFNQMESHADARMAEAYAAHFGKPFDASKGSATKAWVAALAANAPLLGTSDTAAAETVGAPGQKEAFIGLMSTAKFRENADSGYKLGLCTDIAPFIGFTNVGVGVVAPGSRSPNKARLFLHYAMTGEGIAPQAEDGKISGNDAVPIAASEPSGIGKYLDHVLPYDLASGAADWDARQDWQDFWRMNYRR